MGPQTTEKLITCESKNKFWNHSLWTWESDTNLPRAIQKHLLYKIRYNCFLKANKNMEIYLYVNINVSDTTWNF